MSKNEKGSQRKRFQRLQSKLSDISIYLLQLNLLLAEEQRDLDDGKKNESSGGIEMESMDNASEVEYRMMKINLCLPDLFRITH
jgi:hypothetical protein